jgi:hypothetical protein
VDYDLNYHINKYKKENQQKPDNILLLKGGNVPLLFGCDNTSVKNKCGSRSTRTIPFSLKLFEFSFKKFFKKKIIIEDYKLLHPKEKRTFFCDILIKHPDYCKYINNLYSFKKDSLKNKNKNKKQIVVYSPSKRENENNQQIIKYIELKDDISSNADELNYTDFMEYIKKSFKKYKYKPLEIVNNCKNSNNSEDDRIVSFTESQEFITHYFTPQRNLKGMLIWHSVGTGKTCTAISTKSFMFEREDYHILWVTRSTLKEDIWKNMFDKVCDHVIRERISKGEYIPQNPKQIRKYVSERFLPPMSYRQFSNTLEQKNEFSKKLILQNGKTDMLKKTLIIIDEAHKLFSKDLIAMEKPNTIAIKKAIHNSYDVSGKDSCKILLMTATPIADDSMEFFKLMNLIIGDKSKRFPEEYNDLSSIYLDGNEFNTQGKLRFRDNVKGLISYLDRRSDPRQFTQPVFHNMPVKMSKSLDLNTIENCLNKVKTTHEQCVDVENKKNISELIYFKADIETKEIQITTMNDEILKLKENIRNNKKLINSKKNKDNTNVSQSAVTKDINIMTQKINDNLSSILSYKEKIKESKRKIKVSTEYMKSALITCNKNKIEQQASCKQIYVNNLDQYSMLSKHCKVTL